MKTANAGRIVFYHRTDPDTAGRILREGFPAGSTAACELSLERNIALRGSTVLRIAVPAELAETVLNGPSQTLLGSLREYFVASDSLNACTVSMLIDGRMRCAAR